jgi:hypothetical protein
VLTLPGYTFYPSAATALARWAPYARGDFYEFSTATGEVARGSAAS